MLIYTPRDNIKHDMIHTGFIPRLNLRIYMLKKESNIQTIKYDISSSLFYKWDTAEIIIQIEY